MTTPFAAILRRAVEHTPNAIGGAFADSEGEMVDSYSQMDRFEWAVLTAHYGVILQHLIACFGTWHYGGPEYFIATHASIDVVVHSVRDGYFALLACREPAPLAVALEALAVAAIELRVEMDL